LNLAVSIRLIRSNDLDESFTAATARQMLAICLFIYLFFALSALTLLVGHQEEHLACKN